MRVERKMMIDNLKEASDCVHDALVFLEFLDRYTLKAPDEIKAKEVMKSFGIVLKIAKDKIDLWSDVLNRSKGCYCLECRKYKEEDQMFTDDICNACYMRDKDITEAV